MYSMSAKAMMSSLTEVIVLLNVVHMVSTIEQHPYGNRNSLQVVVTPKDSVLRPGESVVVQCLVNSGARKDNFPSVGFYLQLEKNTVVPINSDLPGITVSTVAAAGTYSKYGRYNKSITYVTIGQEIYHVLRKLENHFICMASTSTGEHQKDYFTVWKVPYSLE